MDKSEGLEDPVPKRLFPIHVLALAKSCDDALPRVSPDFLVLADALADLGEEEAAAHCRMAIHGTSRAVLNRILGKENPPGWRLDGATLLQMPVDSPMWGLGSFNVTGSELRALLGEPHYVETDPQCTTGGEEDAWAYSLPSGQRVLIVLSVTSGWAELYGDPPDLNPILQTLGILPDDSRLARRQQFWLATCPNHPALQLLEKLTNGVCEDDYSIRELPAPGLFLRFRRVKETAYLWRGKDGYLLSPWHAMKKPKGRSTQRVGSVEEALDLLNRPPNDRTWWGLWG